MDDREDTAPVKPEDLSEFYGVVTLLSGAFGVAAGCGAHECGMVVGFSVCVGVVAFLALGIFLCWVSKHL